MRKLTKTTFIVFVLMASLMVLSASAFAKGDTVVQGDPVAYCSMPGLPVSADLPPAVDTISVPDSYTLGDVDVYLNIPHTWVGDVIVTVEHNGTPVTIVDQPGVPDSTFGCSGDDYDVVVNDEGGDAPIEGQCGAAAPAIAGNAPGNNPLAAFDGMDVTGDWTVTVSDSVGGDDGTLAVWCVCPDGAECPPPPAAPPEIDIDPTSLESTLEEGANTETQVLNISNLGEEDLNWEIAEEMGGGVSIPASDGNFPTGTAALSLGAAPLDSAPVKGYSEQPISVLLGNTAYGAESILGSFSSMDLDAPDVLNSIAPYFVSAFTGAGAIGTDPGTMMIFDGSTAIEFDTATGATNVLGFVSGFSIGDPSGLTYDTGSGQYYAIATDITQSILYTVNFGSLTATQVGNTGMAGAIALAFDGSGRLYSYDIVDDNFYQIDTGSGAASIVGSIGFDANFGQGMAYDPVSGNMYMAAFNSGTFQPELRIVDTGTGNSAFVGVIGSTTPGGLLQLGNLGIDPGAEPICDDDLGWVSANPTAGTTPGMSTSMVDITFDSTGLPVGVYNGELCVFSNDSDEGLTFVPVQLTVEEDMGGGFTLPADFNFERCRYLVGSHVPECTTTVLTLFANGNYSTEDGDFGKYTRNNPTRTIAMLSSVGPCYDGYTGNYDVGTLSGSGELVCFDGGFGRGEWTATYIGPAGPTPDAPQGDPIALFDIEICWLGDIGCVDNPFNHPDTLTAFSDRTAVTDLGTTGVWVYNKIADSAAFVTNDDCSPVWVGRDLGGEFDFEGKMYCQDGSGQNGGFAANRVD
jgi:hypothetical protein